jgi:hypothetical protein
MPAVKDLFERALTAEGITGPLAKLARSIYMQESGEGKNTTTSNAGAVGGMQIIPSTFKSVADKDWSINDPEQNARAGIRYLKQLDKQAGGDPSLTAAGYYGGPGGMEKARRGVAVSDPRNPNAPNTIQYAAQVTSRLPDYKPTSTVVTQAPQVSQIPQAPVVKPEALPVEVAAATVPPPDVREPVTVNQVDPAELAAWQDFLKAMPKNDQVVQPSQLASYGQQLPPASLQMPRFQSGPMQSLRPNFEAFGSWGNRAGRAA